MDATLREITELVKEENQYARSKGKYFVYSLVSYAILAITCVRLVLHVVDRKAQTITKLSHKRDNKLQLGKNFSILFLFFFYNHLYMICMYILCNYRFTIGDII